ncbi:MAG TPA: NAD(+)/NADH kinase [Ignavibacteria bacterium]
MTRPTKKRKPNKLLYMTFGILGNFRKENTLPVLTDLLHFLKDNHIDFVIEKKLGSLFHNSLYKKYTDSINNLLKKSDIIISLGGDGTFLNTASVVGAKGIPILGVNLGNLGFMAEVGPEEINSFILDILKNKYKVQDLCLIGLKSSKRRAIYGLNEVVIDKCNSIRMIEMEVFYNKEKVVRFVADGIIISTPTGSTGYSLSSGGAIISPSSKVFIITPISPHTLNLRPIIVPDDGEISIKARSFGKIRQTLDGINSTIFDSPADFHLYKAGHTIKVIKKLNRTYFQTLNNKLLWGADKRKYQKEK